MRNCLPIIVAFVLFVAGYGFGLSRVFAVKESIFAGLFCGFLSLCFTGALLQVWSERRNRRRLRDARMGVAPRDGWRVAVAGELQPVGQPIVTPFSRIPAVLCSYSIKSEQAPDDDSTDSSRGRHFAVDLTGFLMNPCEVRGTTESAGLFAFPVLEGFSDDVRRLPSEVRNAWEFVTSTQFEDHTGARKLGTLSALTEAMSEHDGQVSRHIQIGRGADELFAASFGYMELDDDQVSDDDLDLDDDEDDDLDDVDDGSGNGNGKTRDAAADDDDDAAARDTGLPQLIETLVEPGEAVCAFGVYSDQRRGLVPGMAGAVRVVRGTAEQVDELLAKRISTNLRIGLIGHFLLHAAIALVITMYLLNRP
ncbi:MAG TPA: hypothetical protein PLV92_15285 [Pirellulaceae bacterium]|nr:hypothetical protein [Pirellulaceae bacterium]